jgi:hypothetical protein
VRRGVWIAAGVLLALLIVVGIVRGPDEAEEAAESVATSADGYRALLDLLVALGVPAARHAGPPDGLPVDASAWWLSPSVCAGEAVAWEGRTFVEAGGTAVVLLPRQITPGTCSLGGDLTLPARTGLRPGSRVRGREPIVVAGDLVREPRRLPVDPFVLVFAAADGWTVRATADEHPFALERALGAGRLVLVADARLFRNARLDAGDTAPLLVDLVRDVGAPRFVEPARPVAVEGSALAYLVTSPALGPFLGLVLVGLLLAWHGALVPPRRLAPAGMGTPTLDAFVDALAGLYARSRDWPRIAARYRELTAARLRRHFGLPAGTGAAALVARLERDARFRGDTLAPLVAPPDVVDEAGLLAAVAALDALVARAVG